jgi:hypothetical protein
MKEIVFLNQITKRRPFICELSYKSILWVVYSGRINLNRKYCLLYDSQK